MTTISPSLSPSVGILSKEDLGPLDPLVSSVKVVVAKYQPGWSELSLICRVVVRWKSDCCSALRIGLDGSAVDLLLRVVYCEVVWLPDLWFSCPCDDLRLTTQLVSFTATITDWKVVPMAIAPMGEISVYDCFWRLWVYGNFYDCRRFLCLTISYLVDPASSHMLVSKIKPCMSKYKPH